MAPGRLTYVGHATVLIELAGTRVLTDPLLRARVAHIRRRGPVPAAEALLPLDAILISHAHADHLDPPSLRRLSGERPVIAPRGCAGRLRRSRVGPVIEVAPGDRHRVGGVTVEAVPASHDGRRVPIGRRAAAVGFLVEGSARVYFAGDTGLFDGMSALAGRVDVALLPVAGWGPRVPAGHLGPREAAQAAALIQPALAVPIHWGTMRAIGPGESDPQAPPREFAAIAGALEPPVATRVLQPGEAMTLPERAAA